MTVITTVFRCGSMEIPHHDERMEASFKLFDSVAPKGRVLRRDAIFASPEREALQPWIDMKHRKQKRAHWKIDIGQTELNIKFHDDILVRHLDIIEDDSLFIYNADLFGEIHVQAQYSRWDLEQNDPTPYWDSGIPLAEWSKSKFSKTKAAESWEVLVGRHHILNLTVEHNAPELLPPPRSSQI